MKKILLSAALALTAATAVADFSGSGYYRAQNATSERYAYLLDDKGSYNTHTSSADVLALALYSGFLRASSDPASVFYITKVSEDTNRGIATIDIAGQGTSVHGFLDAYLKLWKQKEVGGQMSYLLYAEKSGMVKYLGDVEDSKLSESGYPSAEAKGADRLWWIDPISATSSDSYFGIAPTLTAGGKYYYPFYAAFDYDAYSDGVKFYTISKVENGVAVLNPLNGVVPAATPVIVECSHPLAVDNKLNVGASGNKAEVSGNKLGGVYFDNDMATHFNRTKYDKQTMRILAVKDGKLVFETSSSLQYLPRNQAYLKVASGSAADIKVMTQEEYDAYLQQLEYEKNLISAISLSPASASIEVGETLELTATTTPSKPSNPGLTWTSSDTSVATVDANGKVSAVAKGTAVITVSSDNNVKATASITVTKTVMPEGIALDQTVLTLEKWDEVTLTATVSPDDATDKSVTWTSDNTSVATVTDKGVVNAVGGGEAVITASTANGLKASASVTVTVPATGVKLNVSSADVHIDEVYQLEATVVPDDCTDKSVTWSSSDPQVATVDEAGLVKVLGEGIAVITVTTVNGHSAWCTLNVSAGVDSIITSPEASIYDLNGNRVTSMQKGQVYILRLNGASIKIVR